MVSLTLKPMNASTYVSHLPNDQIYLRDAMNDLISFCETAGSTNWPLSSPHTGITPTLKDRIDCIFEDLFLNPIDYSDFSVSLDTFSPLL